jgi:hypothetical protein
MATRVIEERLGEDCNDIESACIILNEDTVADNARILDGKTLHDHCDESNRNNSTRTLATLLRL